MFASIWLASSRVGDSTRTRQARGLGLASDSIRRPRIGSEKAAVLPVPVCAMPSRSRPASTCGMAPAWMGVGVSYPSAVSAWRIGAGRPRSENVVKVS